MSTGWHHTLLGWKLALVDRGLADAPLLDSYQAERWPIGRFVLRFTELAAPTYHRAAA